MSRKSQGKVKARSRQCQGNVKVRSRQGQGQGEVQARFKQSQGKVEIQEQGKINVRLRQSNHNHNHNYNSMGFDTIEINLVQVLKSVVIQLVLFCRRSNLLKGSLINKLGHRIFKDLCVCVVICKIRSFQCFQFTRDRGETVTWKSSHPLVRSLLRLGPSPEEIFQRCVGNLH